MTNTRMASQPANASWFARFGRNLLHGATLFLRRPHRCAGTPVAWPKPGRLMIYAIVAVVVTAIVTIWLDVRAITAARELPSWFVAAAREFTDFGKSGWTLWPLGILLLVLAAAGTSRRLTRFAHGVLAALATRCGFLFLAIALPGLFSTIVKNMIGRARPFVGGSADAFLYQPFTWKPAYASMPSGHATAAFATFIAFGALFPRARPALFVFAVLVAISRVVVNAHHPSDVIVGALVGAGGAILIRNAFASRRILFSITSGGYARPKTGPSWRRVKQVARSLFAS